MKIFKYLGFIFNSEGNYKDPLFELRREGYAAAKNTWYLGENRCRDDFKRRKMLFNYLVRSVMSYGSEIWGWKARKEIEKMGVEIRFLLPQIYHL